MPKSCRARLSRRDFEFMAAILNQLDPSKEDSFIRLARDPETLNTLLDHPKVLDSLLSMKQPINVSSELYFYVLVRHALKESGVDHLEVADYVAGTLVEFANGNPFYTDAGSPVQIDGVPYHIEFIEAINAANAYDRFYLHVHCGNQFLVLTGLFPGVIKIGKTGEALPESGIMRVWPEDLTERQAAIHWLMNLPSARSTKCSQTGSKKPEWHSIAWRTSTFS